jgi:tetratricopeptide (TPR) repeat protein
MRRLMLVTALALVIALLETCSVLAQGRSFCISGVSTEPSVYIDSSSSEVVVVTNDGRQLNALSNFLLCPGDEVRTGATGRVAIRFNEKRTVIRLDGNSRTRILSGGTGDHDVSLLYGILHFVSSVRRHFWVDTPYIVAGIEGTEALVAVQPSKRLAITAVREGVVTAYDRSEGPGGKLAVSAGEAAFRSSNYRFQSAPIESLPAEFRSLIIVSDSAVDWAVYYPPILLVKDTRDQAVRDAIVLLSSGDYERAATRLNSARKSEEASVASLQTIIAISRNRLSEAEKWSARALQANQNYGPAHIAASYVRQASGDLEGALEFARNGVKLTPDDPYATARLAEVLMILGDRPAALETAERSLSRRRTPLALFVAGLGNLANWQYRQSESYFVEAIELDPEAPLPRLGLGLSYVRQARISEGAWEIERAVAHDPKRASLRNWLGRAYFEENESKKAANEFRLAQAEDPEDPTSYLFAAIERFSANQPIAALRELQEAEKYREARRVLRSEAGLHEDTATRGAALGRIYDVLDFDQLAIVEGAEAVETAPANPGAHRFLADAYRTRPGYEIAQTSELLLSQVLSPPSKTPVQPNLAESDLALLDTTGPSRVTFAEFAPLFDSDGFRVDASGLAGTQETWSGEGSVTGLYRNASLSVGQFHYETDGYRQNNDIEHDIFNAVSTIAISPELTFFGEYRRRKTEGGDRPIDFNIDDFDPTVRSWLDREVARIGIHAQPSRKSDLIGVYTWASLASKDKITDELFGDLIATSDDNSNSAQLQHIWQDHNVRNISGASYISNDVDSLLDFGGLFQFTDSFDISYWSAYSYTYLDMPKDVTWTIGGSTVTYQEDRLDGAEIVEFLPKVGVRAALTDRLTVRGSYLRNVKPDLVTEQVIEPTSVAGFNQDYDAINGSVLKQIGGAIDLALNDRILIGTEAIKRWWKIPIGAAPDANTKEKIYRAYAYITLPGDLALAAEVLHEHSKSDSPGDFTDWRTTSVPISLSYFSESGWFGSAGIEFVDHSFQEPGDRGSDRFNLFNATVGFRLPDNLGILSIEGQNLLDEDFHFQNRTTRPDIAAAPRYAPDRTILLRATLSF